MSLGGKSVEVVVCLLYNALPVFSRFSGKNDTILIGI